MKLAEILKQKSAKRSKKRMKKRERHVTTNSTNQEIEERIEAYWRKSVSEIDEKLSNYSESPSKTRKAITENEDEDNNSDSSFNIISSVKKYGQKHKDPRDDENMSPTYSKKKKNRKIIHDLLKKSNYQDSSDETYEEDLSKPRKTLQKMDSPKRNKYFKSQLRHALLPVGKEDDEDYKEALVEMIKKGYLVDKEHQIEYEKETVELNKKADEKKEINTNSKKNKKRPKPLKRSVSKTKKPISKFKKVNNIETHQIKNISDEQNIERKTSIQNKSIEEGELYYHELNTSLLKKNSTDNKASQTNAKKKKIITYMNINK